jgi:hypothetical protein
MKTIDNFELGEDKRRKSLIAAVHDIQQLHTFDNLSEEMVYQMTLEVNQYLDEELMLKKWYQDSPISSKRRIVIHIVDLSPFSPFFHSTLCNNYCVCCILLQFIFRYEL